MKTLRTIKIHNLNISGLKELENKFKNGIGFSYQSQFHNKSLQINENDEDFLYQFNYNKIFSKIVKQLETSQFYKIKDEGQAFVHFTKVNSEAAIRLRFRMKPYKKNRNIYEINGYPFRSENVTVLSDVVLDKTVLQNFISLYIDECLRIKCGQKKPKKNI